ncbi:MAG: ATP-binding cassette domain-containing protein [Alphaproteobacteria bacterium]|nr:MAG: ATP-binding cassette domain-containing protein [Alphaproteobacteria bacterium]
METVVRIADIHKRFGDQVAVDGLSLAVARGEVFGFLGPNGAGKTTSIRILLDIMSPDRGSVDVLGVRSALSVAHRIGYLPEERGLYRNMTAEGVITYLARLKGLGAREARRRARALLERYGLAAAARRRIRQLSKGMAQKVQVLSTLAHDPDLLILDEPFSGLDPVNQQVLEQVLRDLKAAGKTVIFSTHVMQHAERLCDRILLIARGRNIFEGSVDDAKARLDIRLRLRTEGDVAPLSGLPAIKRVFRRSRDGDICEWEFRAERSLSVERFIAACVEHRIPIRHFTMLEPSLHDVFVRLVRANDAVGGEGS